MAEWRKHKDGDVMAGAEMRDGRFLRAYCRLQPAEPDEGELRSAVHIEFVIESSKGVRETVIWIEKAVGSLRKDESFDRIDIFRCAIVDDDTLVYVFRDQLAFANNPGIYARVIARDDKGQYRAVSSDAVSLAKLYGRDGVTTPESKWPDLISISGSLKAGTLLVQVPERDKFAIFGFERTDRGMTWVRKSQEPPPYKPDPMDLLTPEQRARFSTQPATQPTQ